MAQPTEVSEGPIRLGLVLHPTRDVSEVVDIVLRWAETHQVELAVRAEDRHRVPSGIRTLPGEEFAPGCTALISIGGDGTMLGALRLTAHQPRPVLGVHVGRLGFLVEVTPDELPAALDRLVAATVTLEPRSCLALEVSGQEVLAFNDVALARNPGTGFVHATLSVDGQRYGYYRCDALIVSTPTGSTAYGYAAGGPLVSPAAQVLTITPSAPMSGIARSIVLSPEEAIRLDMLSDSAQLAVEADGRIVRHIGAGGQIEIGYRRDAGLVVRIDPRRHLERSQLKLSLLDLPLLPEQLRELLPESLREEFDRRAEPPPA